MHRTFSDIVRTCSLRARLARRGRILLPAALAALGCAQVAHAGHAVTSWLGPTNGNWTTASMWSAGVPFNNGTNTFDAIIAAAGSPYTVTLGSSISLSSFALSSSDATVNHTGGIFAVLHPMSISAGTYHLNGGTISGGTINLSGSGRLAFGSGTGRLDGTAVNGGLSLTGSGSTLARLLNGARFTGDATLSAPNGILNFEYDATIQSGQTITLDSIGMTLGVSKNTTTNTDSTLTFAPGATVRGRGLISSGNFTGGSENRVVNDGTVAADISAGQLTVNPNTFVNNSVLQSTGGATLSLGGGSFTNNGTVSATGAAVSIASTHWSSAAGATISASNGTLTTGGTWSNAGSISLNNSTLNLGGTFTTAGLKLANFSRSGGTVNVTGMLDNTAATLPLNSTTGTWRIAGGRIKGGTITRSGGADLVFTNATNILDGASLVGDLALAENSAVARFQNGADFTGNATLSATGGIINYEYDRTIGPGRTINLDGAASALGVSQNQTTSTDSTLTIAAGAQVRGRGQITSGNFTSGSNNQLVNNGTISSDVSGQTLTINPNRFINHGHARAIGGSTLTISSGSWSNAAGGSISIDGSTANFNSNWSSRGAIHLFHGATLHMNGTFSTTGLNLPGISRTGSTTINLGGSLDNGGSTLALSATTGGWRLSGGTITGGTITRAGGADLIFTVAGGVLSGTSIPGDITMSENQARVSMRDGADFTGNAVLSSSSLLNYEYDATLGGGRTIRLDGASLGVARGGTPAADRTLTIAPGATVHGRGGISSGAIGGGTANRVVNNGIIAADVIAQTLNIHSNLFTNNGSLRAVNGSTLSVSAASWSNTTTGSIVIDSSTANFSGNWANAGSVLLNQGTLNMGGTMTTGGLALEKFSRSGATMVNLTGALSNNAETLTLGGASGPIRLAGGTISGGTIVRSGGGELVFTPSGALSGATVIGDITVNETNARARMQNGADFTGNATLNGIGAMLNYESDTTLAAGRTVNLEGSGAMLSVARNTATGTDSTLTLADGAIVRGRGSIASSQFTGGSTNHVINHGLIHADMNAGLNITPNRFTNHGTLRASNNGSLTISNTTFTNAAGRFEATGGGKIRAFTITGNVNSSLADGAGSQLDLDGASYTINQPVAVTNGALMYLRGGWEKNADMNVGGRVVFDYPAPDPASSSPLQTIRSQIATGFNNGAWNGPGINSAQAAANSAYGVGYAESRALFPAGSGGTWGGVHVDDHAVLVAYTRWGDADLNGTVNLSDFNRLAANFGHSGKLWTDGDFDYNGIVNLSDFNRLAANFGLAAGPGGPTPDDWSALASAVPEPTLSLMALPALASLRRRRTR